MMSYVVKESLLENLIGRERKNMIKCNHCGDIIESAHCHDFATCSCGCCSVDGGTDYLRRCFANSTDDFTDLSIFDGDENSF